MKKVICSEHAPAAIGPYAQAIAANGIVFTSGQLPIDPATGAFPEGIAAQTKQSLTNVKAILAEAGTGMDQVIKTTVFLSSPAVRQTKKKRKQQKRKVLSAKQSRNRKTGFDNRGTSKTHNWR